MCITLNFVRLVYTELNIKQLFINRKIMSVNLTRMPLRSICKLLFKKTSPIVCLTPLFTNSSSNNNVEITEENKLKLPDVNTLTYNYMIRQSTLKAINNASELLTLTYSAIETYCKQYRESLIKLINLHKGFLENGVIDSHEDVIVQIRVEMEDRKATIERLLHFVQDVYRMADSATGMCYMSGMSNLCDSFGQRIDDAAKNVDKEICNNRELEKELSKVQQECIINASTY